MATTTNYGWTTPDDTALVKDGAAAIRALGTSIDTSMNTALGTRKSGLVLLNTTSFSAVASFSLAADTFTSTYDNYKILVQITTAASAGYLTGRVRAAGSDLSGADYASAMIQAAYASTTLGNDNAGATATSFRLSYVDGRQNITMELMNPKTTQFTSFYNMNDRQGYGYQTAGGVYKQTTSVDSFTFISGAGNLTGSYSVYGYNK